MAARHEEGHKKPLGGTWWKVHKKWSVRAEPVIVHKSTTNRVWFFLEGLGAHKYERFESKSSEYHEYFETETEAVAFIRARLKKDIAEAQETVAECGRKLAELNEKYGLET